MTPVAIKRLCLCLMLFVASLHLQAQKNGLEVFGLNQSTAYCTASRSTPDMIVGLDNNWNLLLLLRTPKSIADLDSLGISYTRSQLELLTQWKLIRRNKNVYQTNIPILDSLQTETLRSYARKLSDSLTQEIKGDVSNMVDVLSQTGRSKNAYSILFSYVIDGWVWRVLEDKCVISKRKQLSVENPLWSGEFWTLYPKRAFYCGTNSITEGRYAMRVNWSKIAIPKMHPFFNKFRLLEVMVAEIADKGRVTNRAVVDEFSKFDVLDCEGRPSVPVIVEDETNKVYTQSRNIANKVANFLESKVDELMGKRGFAFSNKSQAVVVLYHEIIWDIMGELEAQGIITKPVLFGDTEKARSQDVSDLIFFTIKKARPTIPE